MKAVITVTGKDTVGIIAQVSAVCAEAGANILEITQSVLSEYFAMIMLTDIGGLKLPFSAFADKLTALGIAHALNIHTMHEEIFDSMHRI